MTLQTLSLTGLLVFCLPMAASPISSSLTDMAESHNEPRPEKAITSFHQIPAALESLGCKDIGTTLCEYLTYKDYARLKSVSSAWHAMMETALNNNDNEQEPLLLPTGNALVSYIQKLFDNAPPNDPARLSILQALKPLCERSYYPGNTLFDAFRLYASNVPEEERIFTTRPDHWVEPIPQITEIVNLSRELAANMGPTLQLAEVAQDAPLDLVHQEIINLAQRSQAEIERLKPLLKKWQPYGVMLKLARTFPPIEIAHSSRHIWEDRFLRAGGSNSIWNIYWNLREHDPLNLLEAPQISETHPIIQPHDPLFVSSGNAYWKIAYTEDQRIQTWWQRIEQHKKRIAALRNNGIAISQHATNFLNQLTKTYYAFVYECANRAHVRATESNDPLAKKEHLKRAATLIFRLDVPPPGSISLFSTDDLYKLESSSSMLYKAADSFPEYADEYLRKAVAWCEYSVMEFGSRSSSEFFKRAAKACYRLAESAHDANTKGSYYKKQAYFLNTLLTSNTFFRDTVEVYEEYRTIRAQSSSETLSFPVSWFTEAAAAHLRAAQYSSGIREKIYYLTRAALFKTKVALIAVLVDSPLDGSFNQIVLDD